MRVCVCVCVCVCVWGGGGGGWGSKGGSMPPLQGFVNEVRKDWMPPPQILQILERRFTLLLKLKQLILYSLRNFLMCQLFPKFDILNTILLVSQHEITKSMHFFMYMVTFKLFGLILH